MATRTYQIGLYLALNTLYRYMTRWQPKIEAGLSEDQLTCFQAVLAAVTECLPLFLPPTPND